MILILTIVCSYESSCQLLLLLHIWYDTSDSQYVKEIKPYHGYTSHASPRDYGARLGRIVRELVDLEKVNGLCCFAGSREEPFTSKL